MLCPLDQTELRITEREKVEIDYCPTCRGVWLDRGELDKIIERFAADRPATTTGLGRPDVSQRYGPYGRPDDDDDARRRYAAQRGYRYDDDDDDDDDRYRGRRRRNWLGDLFDF